MKNFSAFALALIFALGFGQDAFAYIGPGAGLGMIGSLWGLLAAVVAALAFLLLWPIKRMLRKSSANNASTEAEGQDKPAG